VTADFDLDDGHSREQLAIACEAADRAAEARDAIATHGLLLEGRFGLKQNPAVAIERDARIRQLRALRELGLDLDVAETRPPTTWRGRTR
jgi:phage terminase small subunit